MLQQLQNMSGKMTSFISTILTMSLIFGGYSTYAEDLNDVRLVIDGKWHAYEVGDITVEELLQQSGVELRNEDIINVSTDTVIDKDMKIVIDKAVNVVFKVDGESPVSILTQAKTIGEALSELRKKQGREFKLEENKSSSTLIDKDTTISVTPYIEKTRVVKEEIKFNTKHIENPNLPEGTEKITTKGVNGINETTFKDIYLKDELVSSEEIASAITKKPIQQIVEVGTKKPTPILKTPTIKTEKGTFIVEKELQMRSTAYTAGYISTGKNPGDPGYGITASGMKAQRGVVAVDTKVIPFGTKLYIEGYGYAIAGDTGSAIKGNKIDVFFDSYTDAINYGVKNVKVYILGSQV